MPGFPSYFEKFIAARNCFYRRWRDRPKTQCRNNECTTKKTQREVKKRPDRIISFKKKHPQVAELIPEISAETSL